MIIIESMPDIIKILNNLNVIQIESYGSVSYETILLSIQKIKKINDETGIEHILVDARKQESMPREFFLYEFASNLPEHLKFAIIISREQDIVKAMELIKITALEKGIRVEIFENRQEALDWLNRD